MHYAISHQTSDIQFLSVTPRKKLMKHTLLSVDNGLVLVRLGKNEYAIKPGQAMWLPFDCLTSICCLPQTRMHTVELSCRVSSPLPKQAGYIELNELSAALLNRMATLADDHQAKINLLTVLREDLHHYAPTLELDSFSDQISRWQPNVSSPLDQNIQVALRVREARKRLLSGQGKAKVINELFSGSEEAYHAICQTVLGE